MGVGVGTGVGVGFGVAGFAVCEALLVGFADDARLVGAAVGAPDPLCAGTVVLAPGLGVVSVILETTAKQPLSDTTRGSH